MLRDITSGNNDTDGLLTDNIQAGAGWDACTGWGVPDGQKLLAALKGGGNGNGHGHGSSKVASTRHRAS